MIFSSIWTDSGKTGDEVSLDFGPNQLFKVKRVEGEEAVLEYLRFHGPTRQAVLRSELIKVPGCSTMSRVIASLKQKKLVKHRGGQTVPVSLVEPK